MSRIVTSKFGMFHTTWHQNSIVTVLNPSIFEAGVKYHHVVRNYNGSTKYTYTFNGEDTKFDDGNLRKFFMFPGFYVWRYQTTLFEYKDRRMRVIDSNAFDDVDKHEFTVYLCGIQEDIDVWKLYLKSLESYGECTFTFVEHSQDEPFPEIGLLESRLEISRRLYADARMWGYEYDDVDEENIPALRIVKKLFNLYEQDFSTISHIPQHDKYSDFQ